jgi:periplasmic divalent cation tolerance protein
LTESTDIVEVTTTLPDQLSAMQIAEKLVEQRLAGCVQVTGPITSIYRWQGTLRRDVEYRLTIKSLRQMIPSLIEVVSQSHPYQVPEILVVNVARTTDAYALWLMDQVNGPNG